MQRLSRWTGDGQRSSRAGQMDHFIRFMIQDEGYKDSLAFIRVNVLPPRVFLMAEDSFTECAKSFTTRRYRVTVDRDKPTPCRTVSSLSPLATELRVRLWAVGFQAGT